MTTTPTALSTALSSSGLPLHPSPHFLTTILTSSQPRTTQPPLAALAATARHRLLGSDFTSAPGVLDGTRTPCFPADVSDPRVRERRLGGSNSNGSGGGGGGGGGPVPVQVLGVEDLSRSRWEQLEAIEARERGEGTRGREIIRVMESEEQGGVAGGGVGAAGVGAGAGRGSGPHRLVLQDVKGRTVFGLELKPVKGVGMDMSIGTKMVLNGVTVARGILLLEPETAVVLGGKIDSLHKAWVENRKRDLEAAVEGNA